MLTYSKERRWALVNAILLTAITILGKEKEKINQMEINKKKQSVMDPEYCTTTHWVLQVSTISQDDAKLDAAVITLSWLFIIVLFFLNN